MVDAVNDRQVGAVCRGRDKHALGAGGEVGFRLVFRGEDTGAFHRDVHVEFAVGQVLRITDGGHEDRLAVDDDLVTINIYICRKTAMYRIETEQVGVGFNRSEIVDGHHFDIGASMLDDRPKNQAADAAESVDGYTNGHLYFSSWASKFTGLRPFKWVCPPRPPRTVRHRDAKRDKRELMPCRLQAAC